AAYPRQLNLLKLAGLVPDLEHRGRRASVEGPIERSHDPEVLRPGILEPELAVKSLAHSDRTRGTGPDDLKPGRLRMGRFGNKFALQNPFGFFRGGAGFRRRGRGREHDQEETPADEEQQDADHE